MVVLLIVIVLMMVIVLIVVVVRILFRNDDVVVRFLKNFFMITCPRELFFRFLILIMIFFRIVLGAVRGFLELRLLTPGVVEVRLVVVEDVDVDPVGVDRRVVLHPLLFGLDEGGLPVLVTVELIVFIILSFKDVRRDDRLLVRAVVLLLDVLVDVLLLLLLLLHPLFLLEVVVNLFLKSWW